MSFPTVSAAETAQTSVAWDRWHRHRDALEHLDQLPAVAVWRELAIRQLPEMNGRNVLDCASARGGFSRVLADLGAEVTAVDLSEVAVELTRRQLGPGRGRTIKADARSLPFPDDTFDVGICLQTVNHVQPGSQVLSELVRVTRPSGRIVVTFSNYLSPLGVSRLIYRLLRTKPDEYPPSELFLTVPGVLKPLRKLGVEVDAVEGGAYGLVVPGYGTARLHWLKYLPKSHYLAFHVCISGTVRKP